ncbi:MAG: hypothetical protein B7Y12_00680 [Rhizobiales bacterium 24-66-13]|nr:MAG: hypothetical protein B7Y95_04160 [Rhizobiales bacterium 32-66-11]OYY14026.1 MAG: hypothetical protein B7Y70_00165 [Rhizobiales bacterium 35-68-8]OYZ83116.1 MAG: hypothetical protein B7Y12_00680 [Rhizobiales bacterium 24-66-13]OZB12046.1 MAG: hypothetical protein B7X67_01265 [Rhizobiales bacterium 39-66-18]HQS45618.1 hypothetical protein [Xanthobacteraceae bacterium]
MFPVAVILIPLVHGATASAQDDLKRLGEKEIRAKVIGKEITDASHWGIYLRPDGVLLSDEMGRKWPGTWEIQEGRLCMSNPGNDTLDCFEVWMSGSRCGYNLGRYDGRPQFCRPHSPRH